MNRPLAAFGALMTFLVLAMFAVSSTGRSTTVQAVRPAKRLAVAQAWRSLPKELQVASADKTVRWTGSSEERKLEIVSRLNGDCEGASCGKVMAETYLTSLTSLKVAGTKQAELAAVRIVPVSDAMESWRAPEPMGCASCYDAEYDRAVYGSKEPRTKEPKNQSSKSQEPVVGEEELTALFYGLVVGAGQPTTAAQGVVGTVQPAGIDWAEYAELIDGAIEGADVSVETAKTSAGGGSVRSGDWLRHSAALSLNRVGALLQSAALVMEQTGGISAGRTAEGLAR